MDKEQGKGNFKNSTPLHIMCQTLAAMKDDLKTGTAKSTVFIDHIPASLASEAKLRDKLQTRKYIDCLETDVEWVRLRTRSNGTTMAVVRFAKEGSAEAAKADPRIGLAVQDFFSNLQAIRAGGLEDQVFVEDLAAEQETLDKYKLGVQVRGGRCATRRALLGSVS